MTRQPRMHRTWTLTVVHQGRMDGMMRTELGAATRESARYSHLRVRLPDCDFFRSLLKVNERYRDVTTAMQANHTPDHFRLANHPVQNWRFRFPEDPFSPSTDAPVCLYPYARTRLDSHADSRKVAVQVCAPGRIDMEHHAEVALKRRLSYYDVVALPLPIGFNW
jgi:hypothetical protein